MYFFSMMLAKSGAKVKHLIDDGVMVHCDSLQYDSTPIVKHLNRDSLNPYYRRTYKNLKNIEFFSKVFIQKWIFKKALKTYKVKNLEIIKYSDIIKKIDIKLENLSELKKHASSSTFRFFRASEIDLNNEFMRKYYNLSLMNAAISKSVANYIMREIKPDVFINPHGIYSTHGPAFDLLKKNGIKCFIFGGHNRRRSALYLCLLHQ